jgi:hypothetical protein
MSAQHKDAVQAMVQKAKEKVSEYKNQQAGAAGPDVESETGEGRKPLPRTDEGWNDLISHHIEEAMRAGAFDNLRNKGKPLNMESNPYVSEDQQMANKLLENNDLAPGWILERKELLEKIETLRGTLRKQADAHVTALAAASDEAIRARLTDSWHYATQQWQKELTTLNKRIGEHNITLPIRHLEIFKLRLADELARLGVN